MARLAAKAAKAHISPGGHESSPDPSSDSSLDLSDDDQPTAVTQTTRSITNTCAIAPPVAAMPPSQPLVPPQNDPDMPQVDYDLDPDAPNEPEPQWGLGR